MGAAEESRGTVFAKLCWNTDKLALVWVQESLDVFQACAENERSL